MKIQAKHEKQCGTCANARGIKHFAPHAWCTPQRAFYEKDHVCDDWSGADGN